MLEVVIVIAVIAILAGLIAPLAVNTIKQSRLNACWEEIQIIKKAIVGDPSLVQSGSRSHFGFVGDLGDLPADGNLGELITKAATRPVYQQDATSGIYYGWRGPYSSEILDPWRHTYYYKRVIVTAASTDKTIAYIWSSGPDGQTNADPLNTAAINNDNIRISIMQDEAYSMIAGNTLDECGSGINCTITIYSPNGLTVPVPTAYTSTPIYNTGNTNLYPIGVRQIRINDGINPSFNFIITINNGPITIFNFRRSGTCL